MVGVTLSLRHQSQTRVGLITKGLYKILWQSIAKDSVWNKVGRNASQHFHSTDLYLYNLKGVLVRVGPHWPTVTESLVIYSNTVSWPVTPSFPSSSSFFYLHLYFGWRLNLAWFLCEAVVYTTHGDDCRCSKPGDTRAMYNETPAVRTAVTLSKSKQWSNNNNTSVHFKERKHHWNTLYRYWIFF